VVRHPYVRNSERGQCRHNENDVILRIAGLDAAGTGRRYGDWRQAQVVSAGATL